MISVVIPTHNAEAHLGETLAALIPAAVEGLVREVIIADGGSTDRTLEVADGAGADIVKAAPVRSAQLKAGVALARFPWLLFLDSDTVLATGWEREANHHIERVESGRRRAAAAAFRLSLDEEGMSARMRERLSAFRTYLLKLPAGEQGLLLPRRVYDEVGGFGALSWMEDVDLVRRLGRRRLTVLDARAVSGGFNGQRDGGFGHSVRHQASLGLCLLGVPVRTIAAVLGPRQGRGDEPAIQRGAS